MLIQIFGYILSTQCKGKIIHCLLFAFLHHDKLFCNHASSYISIIAESNFSVAIDSSLTLL